MIMLALFWICLLLILYTYLGYPLLLMLLPDKSVKEDPGENGLPTVSLIIAAYNEERVIEVKLQNSCKLDYPKDKLEIVVVSDASNDNTDRLVMAWQNRGVKLLRVEGRKGKTSAQNAAVRATVGEILVFSDANAMYDSDAIKQLIRPFKQKDVGCVEGRRLDYSPHDSGAAKSELSYRDYESWIKVLESRCGSCTGATGPIYAIRRSAFIELAESMISDLMEPLMIRFKAGLRHIYVPQAISREEVLDRMGSEFQRKVRIITRCLNSITSVPGLLSPFHAGFFAVQIWSHRLLRWLVPIIAIVMLLSAAAGYDQLASRLMLWAAGVFLLVSLAGWIAESRSKQSTPLLRIPYYFTAANLAALIAWFNWIRGRNIHTWNPDRGR
jgi:biofilm PGA synthesis N-glycosyltransferase PgaC